ncbi:MAG: DMT family transporter [Oscillatoriales cyanobacterium]|uniref:DMT family transporter n=1 Tax=Microcoleus anatoxicus PTRS2 TaxID=2705321 RepID=A0ABU8YP03_9CYAN|nr:MAG: DMT family transporter [Oscillatoriales cyanobacterium]TAE00794.1 MAG: DMT family transporter [Oscillatoriales cyanobacterium]
MQLKITDSKLPFAPLLLIAPFFLWGTAMVAMKGVMPHTTPLFVAVVRLMPAGVLVLLAAAFMGKAQPQGWKAWLWISLFALVDGTLFQGFLAEGLARTGAGLGSVMIDSQPLAVAILCFWLFQEKIGFWGWLGLVIGVIGISLIGLPDGWILGLFHPKNVQVSADVAQLFEGGEWLMLLAALSMAVGTVLVRWVCRYVDPVVATGWHMILGGLPLLAISVATESEQFVNIDFSGWMALSYSTVFGSAIAYGLFFYFASSGSLTSLSSLTFLTPVFALLFGNLFLGEVLNPLQSMGVGLTLVSIYLINQRDTLADKWRKVRDGEVNADGEATGLLDSSELNPVELPVQVRVSELESEV